MAENKRRSIFENINALNMSTGDTLTERERAKLERYAAEVNKKVAKHKRAM
jgi:hypothetical protein